MPADDLTPEEVQAHYRTQAMGDLADFKLAFEGGAARIAAVLAAAELVDGSTPRQAAQAALGGLAEEARKAVLEISEAAQNLEASVEGWRYLDEYTPPPPDHAKKRQAEYRRRWEEREGAWWNIKPEQMGF